MYVSLSFFFLDARRFFPAWSWLPFIAAMLKPWIPDIETATYGGRPMTGLRTATFTQQVTVPPDAFLDGATLATRGVSFAAGFTLDAPTAAYVIPMAHVQPPSSYGGAGGAGGGWLKGSPVEALWATSPDSGAEEASVEPADPLLIEVAAGSSAAAGILASPAMLEQWPVAKGAVAPCLPLGLETAAGPVLAPGFALPKGQASRDYTVAASDLAFRYLDGGFTDNTNAAFTLARMQAECASAPPASPSLDCSQNVFRMIVGSGSYQELLWFDPAYPPGTFLPPSQGGWFGPTPTIFAEPFPSADAWKPYATAAAPAQPLAFNNSEQASAAGGDGTGLGGDLSTSYFWAGRLTSVANEWYGVAAGSTVELLFFKSSASPIIVAGADAAKIFSGVYAPAAVAQAQGAAPIIAAFLTGSLLS